MHESDATEHPVADAHPVASSAEPSAATGAPAADGVPADEPQRGDAGAGESVSAQPEGTLGFEPVTPAEQSTASAVDAPAAAGEAAAPEAVVPEAAAGESAAAESPVAEAPPQVSAAAENEPAPVGAEPPQTEFTPAAEPAPAMQPQSEERTAETPAAAETASPAEAAPAVEASAPETAPVEASAATEGAVSAAVAGESAEVVTSEPSKKPPVDPAKAAQEAARNEERKRRAQQAWERVVAARENGEVLTGTVTAAVKGGLLVDVGGIRGFLPASQVRVQQGTALDTLVKTKIPLKVIDVDQNRRRIVVSHRRAADEERRTKRTELLRSLEVGQTREGTVVRLTDFGAFVDLGGVDGLIPMRELAFERIDKAGDVVHVGEVLPVEVLRIDENGKKISLSRKNALPDPWRDHANVLRQGQTVEGKVVAKEPRLQVELAPGVVGTVRESDANPADYEIGEAIEVIVRRADRATRRITLSPAHGAAAAQPPPQMGGTSSGFAPLGVELGRRRS
ncbi:MAG TPA: S1 RNA-binding domain-containing protein [Candidatus Elarobacter sp.]|jgi:predicted RNA-binding protein with RPS1 domain|nr:S1 RNA-binding domain-containing protein [Candidatus Elarobacter sp.]